MQFRYLLDPLFVLELAFGHALSCINTDYEVVGWNEGKKKPKNQKEKNSWWYVYPYVSWKFGEYKVKLSKLSISQYA
jgi:hypothetical protein